MSIARHHSEWLSLVEVSGPFLSMPVLLRVFPQGLVAHDPEKFRTLKLAFEEWQANNDAGRYTNPAIHGAWIKFLLTTVLGLPADAILEHQAIPQTLAVTPPGEHAETVRPNLVLNDPATKKPRLLIQTYPADQNLDKPVAGRSWPASPGTRMMELCHATGVRLGLVTNGERWMLVDAPKNETTGFASWYATLWTEEPITLRAFVSLLSADRFFGVAEKDTLESLLAESASNQQEVTDQLGYQVRNAVEVLVQAIDRIDQDRDGKLLKGVDEKLLYEAALTYMMRLVFLFSAEERRLFPLDNELYANHYAASTLGEQLRDAAEEEVLERRHDAWSRLLSTFRLIYGGCDHPELRMPSYAGNLFDPDRFPFLEGRPVGTKWTNCEAEPLPVNNRTVLHLLEALQLLQVKVPGSSERQARRLSFRALDIEQIGHVYEGLLDHTAKRATEPMLGLAGGRDKEPEVPLSLLEDLLADSKGKLIEYLREETGRTESAINKALVAELDLHDGSRLRVACGNDEKLFARVQPFAGLIRPDTYDYPTVIRKGSVFVTAGTDRRSSGTHYTPRSLTEPIVQHTLEPLVYIGPAEGKPQEQWQLRTAKELLDLKICDMACGSGAFLVQACRYVSERLVEAWGIAEKNHPSPNPGKLPIPTIMAEGKPATGAPGESLIPRDAAERLAYARRVIAQRCLYGVDINPLAAEMAKLSLWLLTLAKDRPFTFLDHAIRCGDSLVGVRSLQQLKRFSLDGKGQQYVFGETPLDDIVNEAIRHRLAIERAPAETSVDLDAKADDLQAHEHIVAFLKFAADLLVCAELKPGNSREKLGYRDDAAIQIGHARQFENSGEHYRQFAERALAGRRTFHWPLEFPEVFARNGFDAVIGNPPFRSGSRISVDQSDEFLAYLKAQFPTSKGNTDLVCYFFLRAGELVRNVQGCIGLIATNSISQGDNRTSSLVPMAEMWRIIFSRPDLLWPGTANLFVSIIVMATKGWHIGKSHLNGREVGEIDTTLSEMSVAGEPYSLAANAELVFKGIEFLGDGFKLSDSIGEALYRQFGNRHVVRKWLNGADLTESPHLPTHYAIDFADLSLEQASRFGPCFSIVEKLVKPVRANDNRPARRERWWQFGEKAMGMRKALAHCRIALVRPFTSDTYFFEPVVTDYLFTNALIVVATGEMDMFAVLNSSIHEAWARLHGSSMKMDFRYTPSKCFESFPFPNLAGASPGGARSTLQRVGESYLQFRRGVMESRREGLTPLYNRFNDRTESAADIRSWRERHVEMDRMVVAAYGWDDLHLGHDFHELKQGTRFTISDVARRELLARLLKLNHERYAEEMTKGSHGKAGKSTTLSAVESPTALEMPLFAQAYPASDTDRSICAVALSLLASVTTISSADHLDAILLATHPEWCKAFLDAAATKKLKQAISSAPKSLFLKPGAPVRWKECRAYLEQRGGLVIDHALTAQPLRGGANAGELRSEFPADIEGVVTLALEAVNNLKQFRKKITTASEDQKRLVLAIQKYEEAMGLVA